MKWRTPVICVLAFFLITGSAVQMSDTISQKRPLSSLKGISNLPLFLAISVFNLERVMVGYLWLRFDLDSTGSAQNYHRLLPYLELITIIKPDEFQAWGLATFMRCKRYKIEGKPEKTEYAMQRLSAVVEAYPENDRGHHELAYMYAFFFRDYEKALPSAYKAWRLNPDSQMNYRLYAFVSRRIRDIRMGRQLEPAPLLYEAPEAEDFVLEPDQESLQIELPKLRFKN
jgi:tetratricopeptide (TPR) repeat protein